MPSYPDAKLLIAPRCPHCQSVLKNMSDLVKEGKIGRLEVVNIAAHPEIAQQHSVRTAPWLKIGPFELVGNYSLPELTDWVQKAASDSGETEYLRELLEQQQLDKALERTINNPTLIHSLIDLLNDEDMALSIRLGLSAIVEDLAPRGLLTPYIENLAELTRSELANLRADGAHYLGLTGSKMAEPYIRKLLDDPVADVREIAQDSLVMLAG